MQAGASRLVRRIGAEVTGRFLRYAVVGLVSNAALYLLYLVLTGLGVGHKTAMTLVFLTGVAATYRVNKNWSFKASDDGRLLFVKYAAIYVSAYLLSLLLMWLLVDVYGFAHELVQGILIILSAVFIFLNLRIWVFRGVPTAESAGGKSTADAPG